MADYYKCIPLSLKYEGGYCDIKEDAGGATNHGISLRFAKDTEDYELFDLDNDGEITKYDIKMITEEIATEAFKKYFWDRFELSDIESNKKAFVIFDCLINSGSKNAARITQRALVACGHDVDIDGKWGPITKRTVDICDEDCFVEEFLYERSEFFKRIVRNKPSQKIFLKGWLNRIRWNQEDVDKL